MMHRAACSLALFLFLFSNTAFAANWVYVTTSNLFGMPTRYYVDSETVIKNKDTITYWRLVVRDKTDPALGVKTYVEKIEAIPKDPRGTRSLEMHNYGPKGEYIFGYPTSDETKNRKFGSVINKGSPEDMSIDVALKYAREGKDSGQIPKLP